MWVLCQRNDRRKFWLLWYMPWLQRRGGLDMNKDLYTMVGLAEGFVEGTELEVIEAWQYLHDSGHAYKLQGWFGRTAQALLEEGIIEWKILW